VLVVVVELSNELMVQAKERMMKIVKRVIEERNNNIHNKKNTEEKGGAVNDVVDVLLRDIGDSNTISNMLENICENIIEMMIPGEETLPTAMTMAVKFLSDSPLALSKLLVHFLTHHPRFLFLFFKLLSIHT